MAASSSSNFSGSLPRYESYDSSKKFMNGSDYRPSYTQTDIDYLKKEIHNMLDRTENDNVNITNNLVKLDKMIEELMGEIYELTNNVLFKLLDCCKKTLPSVTPVTPVEPSELYDIGKMLEEIKKRVEWMYNVQTYKNDEKLRKTTEDFKNKLNKLKELFQLIKNYDNNCDKDCDYYDIIIDIATKVYEILKEDYTNYNNKNNLKNILIKLGLLTPDTTGGSKTRLYSRKVQRKKSRKTKKCQRGGVDPNRVLNTQSESLNQLPASSKPNLSRRQNGQNGQNILQTIIDDINRNNDNHGILTIATIYFNNLVLESKITKEEKNEFITKFIESYSALSPNTPTLSSKPDIAERPDNRSEHVNIIGEDDFTSDSEVETPQSPQSPQTRGVQQRFSTSDIGSSKVSELKPFPQQQQPISSSSTKSPMIMDDKDRSIDEIPPPKSSGSLSQSNSFSNLSQLPEPDALLQIRTKSQTQPTTTTSQSNSFPQIQMSSNLTDKHLQKELSKLTNPNVKALIKVFENKSSNNPQSPSKKKTGGTKKKSHIKKKSKKSRRRSHNKSVRRPRRRFKRGSKRVSPRRTHRYRLHK
jgi:hypothetical protein